MNKLDFLRKLDKALSVLDKEERREILRFYEERFYTGTMYENKTEEEVVAELERPESIARNVLEEYGVSEKYVKTKEERYSNVSSAQVIWLIIFDVFVASWIIPTLVSVAFSILGTSFTYFSAFSLLLGERTTVDEFMFAFVTAGYILYFLFGLVVLGATIFVIKSIIVWHLNVFKIRGRDKWIKRMSRWSLDGWFKRHRGLNRLKNLLLVGSLVTIAYTGFWIFNHYDWVEAEYGAGEAQEELISEDFASEIVAGDEWTIITDFENMDVEIVLTDGDEFTVIHQYYEDDEFTYDFDYTNNVLTMTSDFDTQFHFEFANLFQLFSANYKVRVEVPRDLVLEEADITTLNGTIDIRNVNFSRITAETSNGAIDISHIELVDNITVSTTNGSIIIKDVIVSANGTLHATTSNGFINIESVNFKEYDLKTTNGNVRLDNLNVELQDGLVLDVNTTNGSIDMEEVYVDDIDLDTTNGSIDFYNDDTTFMPSNFEHDTTNGDFSSNVR